MGRARARGRRGIIAMPTVWVPDMADTYYAYAVDNTVHDIAAEDVGIAGYAKLDVAESGAAGGSIIGKTDGATAGYLLYFNLGRLRFWMRDGTDLWTLTSTPTYNDGQWHHFAAVIDRDNLGNCKLVVDGVEVASTATGTLGDVGSISSAQIMSVGAWNGSGTTPLHGQLADVVLSYPADIMAANEMGASGEVVNLMNGFRDRTNWPNREDSWLLNEGTGTTLTGESDNLTLTNVAAWSRARRP